MDVKTTHASSFCLLSSLSSFSSRFNSSFQHDDRTRGPEGPALFSIRSSFSFSVAFFVSLLLFIFQRPLNHRLSPLFHFSPLVHIPASSYKRKMREWWRQWLWCMNLFCPMLSCCCTHIRLWKDKEIMKWRATWSVRTTGREGQVSFWMRLLSMNIAFGKSNYIFMSDTCLCLVCSETE